VDDRLLRDQSAIAQYVVRYRLELFAAGGGDQAQMAGARKTVLGIGIAALLGAMLAVALHSARRKPIVLKGAVIAQDTDPRKELPISDVQITADDSAVKGSKSASGLFNLRLPEPIESKSDSSGLFSVPLHKGVKRGQAVELKFRHPDYQPLDLHEFIGDKLYIARMVPIPRAVPKPDHPDSVVSNVLIRYSMKTTTALNVGSAVRTFEVVNIGNVRCNGQPPCSPDGRWKAAIGSASLDAGEGNEFRNVRVSCIAGPCPFTRIESTSPPAGVRTISVSARNWSDTATFLLEAEVFHPMGADIISDSYPVIFGPTLNFTVPASAEGVSIEAEINGAAIVFPLGPKLFLSWARCNTRVNSDQTKVYRCELKPAYRFP
jgi:hypothetical protein